MRNKWIFVAFGIAAFIATQSCGTSQKAAQMQAFSYSDEVNTIIQGKCYGCHSENGRSDKAKAALMWDNVPTMTTDEQLHILEEIVGVTTEREMPPKGMVERNPDKALTDAEIATFKSWAEAQQKRLGK